MDSHYDQVMKQRDGAGQGTRKYFAYSTILDRQAFLEWRSQHGYDFFDLPEGKLAEATDLALVFEPNDKIQCVVVLETTRAPRAHV
jgi:hypothetical protein